MSLAESSSVTPDFLPYTRHHLDDEDIAAVLKVLQSDWLTTGPMVEQFEEALTKTCGSRHVAALSSGTAALHAAIHALDIGPGDEVIVPTMSFAATANCVLYQGATPVFADVCADTLLIDPEDVEGKITKKTKAIIAVDYAGHPCDYDTLHRIAAAHGLRLIADACHSLGASYKYRPVGTLADMTVFSFHPAKHITTGEGGAVATDDENLTKRIRQFRNHGMSSDHHQRKAGNAWRYEIVDLGYNYRLTDIQCALGLSQLKKLSGWILKQQTLANLYIEALQGLPGFIPLVRQGQVRHANHLFVVRVDEQICGKSRDQVFQALRALGIGANVHYTPIHLHPLYQQRLDTGTGLCPRAEAAYEQILSLPLHPLMTEGDVRRVVDALRIITGREGG